MTMALDSDEKEIIIVYLIKVGVLERWSTGVLGGAAVRFSITPPSNTPSPRLIDASSLVTEFATLWAGRVEGLNSYSVKP